MPSASCRATPRAALARVAAHLAGLLCRRLLATVRPDRLTAGAAARRRLRVSQNRMAPDVNMRPSRPSGGAKSSTVEWASQKNRILQSTFYSQAIYLHSTSLGHRWPCLTPCLSISLSNRYRDRDGRALRTVDGGRATLPARGLGSSTGRFRLVDRGWVRQALRQTTDQRRSFAPSPRRPRCPHVHAHVAHTLANTQFAAL